MFEQNQMTEQQLKVWNNITHTIRTQYCNKEYDEFLNCYRSNVEQKVHDVHKKCEIFGQKFSDCSWNPY